MDRAKAKKIWAQAFETKYSDERAPLLRRLLPASPKDVVALARMGRRRYDRDAGSDLRGHAWLFAASRRENTLLDAIWIRLG